MQVKRQVNKLTTNFIWLLVGSTKILLKAIELLLLWKCSALFSIIFNLIHYNREKCSNSVKRADIFTTKSLNWIVKSSPSSIKSPLCLLKIWENTQLEQIQWIKYLLGSKKSAKWWVLWGKMQYFNWLITCWVKISFWNYFCV